MFLFATHLESFIFLFIFIFYGILHVVQAEILSLYLLEPFPALNHTPDELLFYKKRITQELLMRLK